MAETYSDYFEISVTQPNQTFSKTHMLDKQVTRVRGFSLDSQTPDLLYFRGRVRLEINRREFFSQGHHAHRFQSTLNVPPDLRYRTLDNAAAGNGAVKLDYTDIDDGRSAFIPYTVTVYLDCVKEN